jgi:uncharacterized protein YqjF (DUF2071 family)
MSIETATPMTAAPSTVPPAFLRAGWYHLPMLNFPADADLVQRYVPAGTELDLWQGRAYLSVVGFQFLHTRVHGIPVPFHRHFEEVNLRTYVRRRDGDGWRRGVVFIREIVRRRLIALVARWVYNESYVIMPMRHEVVLPSRRAPVGNVRYEWYAGDRWHSVSADVAGEPGALEPGSEEEFITEHYYGYCRQRDGSTLEYRVEHPSWRVWPASNARLDCDVAAVYGAEFAPFLEATPTSAFVAEGSRVIVRRGVRV